MKKLIFLTFIGAATLGTSVMSAQTVAQSTQTDSSSTTVVEDRGNKTATESATSNSSTDANGVTTGNSSKTATKTRKKHGKVVSKSATEDSSSTTR